MRRWHQLIAVLVFVVLTGLGASTASAAATPAPANDLGGIDSLVTNPPIRGTSPVMLFEQYGPLDYNLTQPQGFDQINGFNDIMNGYAQGYADATYMFGIVVSRLVEWAFSLNLIAKLGPVVDSFTHSLIGTLYEQYLPLAILLAAIMAGYTIFVLRKFLIGLTGIVWAGAMLALAVNVFISPAGMLGVIDNFATGVTDAVVSGVAQEDPGNHAYTASGGKDYEVRLLANRVFTICVYDPWTMVEFGQVDPVVNGDHLGYELLAKNAGQQSNYDTDIQQAPQGVQDWAAGKDGTVRAIVAILLLLASGIMLLLILGAVLTVITAVLVAVFIGCMTVPCFLLAPIPSFGQRVVTSWFVGIVTSVAVGVIASLFLVLALCLLGALDQLAAGVGLIVVGFLDLAMVVVALWLRKAFFNLGKHAVRSVPAMLSGQQVQPAKHDVREASVIHQRTHHYVGQHRQRVSRLVDRSAPAAHRPASLNGAMHGATGGAGAAKGARVAAHVGASNGAAHAGAMAATTKGAALGPWGMAGAFALHAGTKVAHGALRASDAARRNVEHHGATLLGMQSSGPGQATLVHRGDEPSILAASARVTHRGVRSLRTPRLAPPAETKRLTAQPTYSGTWPDNRERVQPPLKKDVVPPQKGKQRVGTPK